MEVSDENLAHLDEVTLFDVGSLKTVHHAPVSQSVYAPSHGIVQHVYNFNRGYLAELSLRRTTGVPRLGSVHDLIWLQGGSADGENVYIGVESEYVFERTGMLVTPALVAENCPEIIPARVVMEAVLYELEPILGFEVQCLIQREDLPDFLALKPLRDYIALDHKNRFKMLIASNKQCLDQMEAEARNYCFDFLTRQRDFSERIRTSISLGIYPVKRGWYPLDLNGLDVGDLVALSGGPLANRGYCLQGFLRLRRVGQQGFKYGVQYNMNDEEVSLEFTGESIDDYQQTKIDMAVPPHEQVELEVVVGHTSIPLAELCAVQSGTLIELGQHSLPLVTLCVNGETILEGELVHFKDQLMVQITKRVV